MTRFDLGLSRETLRKGVQQLLASPKIKDAGGSSPTRSGRTSEEGAERLVRALDAPANPLHPAQRSLEIIF
jgi:hypothetical protein